MGYVSSLLSILPIGEMLGDSSQFRLVMVKLTNAFITTQARKLLGLLYCRFYKHAEPPALLQAELSLTVLEYGQPLKL